MSSNQLITHYKVIKDYEHADESDEYLKVVKGDIVTDCVNIDGELFRVKLLQSDTFGKIPKEYLEPMEPLYDKTAEEAQDQEYEAIEENSENKTSIENGNITENPLSADTLDKPEHLEQFRVSPSYVEMSSDESVNNGINPLPKPKRAQPQITKAADEGYNSSNYSGEAESSAPLLSKTPVQSKQDEAGYEVPSALFLNPDEKSKIKQLGKKRKSLRSFMRRKTTQEEPGLKEDDARENYYDPPPDVRDVYFVPDSPFQLIRILISLITALGLTILLLLLLYLIAGLHPLFAISLSLPVFIILLIAPTTLTSRSFLCTVLLLFPSLFAKLTKAAIVVLIIVFLILGPILGIFDKLKIASYCSVNSNLSKPFNKILPTPGVASQLATTKSLGSGVEEAYRTNKVCLKAFKKVNQYCNMVHETFKNNNCEGDQQLSPREQTVCNKNADEFCMTNHTIYTVCELAPRGNFSYEKMKISDIKSDINQILISDISDIRAYTSYFLPLLIMLVLWEAYRYNKLYLTTKNEDNVYISQRIKDLDLERKNRGLSDVIVPLTRIEFQSYLVRTSFALSKAERQSLLKWFCVLLLSGVSTLLMILSEDYVNSILLVLQTKECKSFYELFAVDRYRLVIYLILGILLFVIVMQSHILRLRSLICDFFYKDMVDIRSKHLYYKILHDRNTFSKHIRRKVLLLSENKRLLRRISYGTRVFKILPNGVKEALHKVTYERCMVCDSLSRKVVECQEPDCQAHYCHECHIDAGQSCLLCRNTRACVSVAI